MPAKARCNHDDSRLSCVDCGAVICGACMVQCPVGNRCKTCSGAGAGGAAAKRRGPAVNGLIVARLLLLCVGLGFGFDVLMPYFSIPFLCTILAFIGGMMLGKLCAPVVADQRLGNGATLTVVFGMMIGMSLGSIGSAISMLGPMLVMGFTSHPDIIFKVLEGFVSVIFNPVAFIVGFLRSSVWRM